MPDWVTEFPLFAWRLVFQWATFFGALAFAIDRLERGRGPETWRKVPRILWIGCIVLACFSVWRDERAATREAERATTVARAERDTARAQLAQALTGNDAAPAPACPPAKAAPPPTKAAPVTRTGGPPPQSPPAAPVTRTSAVQSSTDDEHRVAEFRWGQPGADGLPTIRVTPTSTERLPPHTIVLSDIRGWSEESHQFGRVMGLDRTFIGVTPYTFPMLPPMPAEDLRPFFMNGGRVAVVGNPNLAVAASPALKLTFRFVGGASGELTEVSQLCVDLRQGLPVGAACGE